MSTLKIKRSILSGRIPSELESGELAINAYDGKLFFSNHENVVKEFTPAKAGSAFKLELEPFINGTSFSGLQHITTAIWGATRNITIGNETKSFNGANDIEWGLEEIGCISKSDLDGIDGLLKVVDGQLVPAIPGVDYSVPGISQLEQIELNTSGINTTVIGKHYIISNNAVEILLPENPSIGSFLRISNCATNGGAVIHGNGELIRGSESILVDVVNADHTFTFTAYGWI